MALSTPPAPPLITCATWALAVLLCSRTRYFSSLSLLLFPRFPTPHTPFSLLRPNSTRFTHTLQYSSAHIDTRYTTSTDLSFSVFSLTTSTTTATQETHCRMKTRPSIPAKWLSNILPAVILGLILASTPSAVKADVLCTQFGFDTFQVGSTVEFQWNDNQAVPISSFNLDLFCFENGKLLKTLATLNTATSVSPQNWVVDNSILSFHSDCPLNQYQGVFDWITTNPATGATSTGSSKCKAMLLNGPGVIPAPGTIDPSQQPPDDDPSSSPVVVSDRTKTIVIGVGCAVGALVLAGFIGFYYIRIKNKRAEQDLANKKLREPLQATNHDNHHAPGPPGSGGVTGDGSIIVEMTPVADMGPPGTLAMEQERPVSILTSSFSPPEDTYEKQQRVKREQEQQVYEQQLQQQHLQQQLQHQQQMQMQQQQQTYGGYNGY